MRILVTGAVGFIGFHVANRLLADGHEVVGLDSVNQYYDVRLKEARRADHPLSMYGATKRSNELMAHSYSYLFGLPTTGLRFFTVYGPWGRPDMVLFKFTKAILEGHPINVFNNGQMKRDFTYVDDVVESIVRIMDVIPAADPQWSSERPDPGSSLAPFRLYNVGNHE